jgi:hypothetical protein
MFASIQRQIKIGCFRQDIPVSCGSIFRSVAPPIQRQILTGQPKTNEGRLGRQDFRVLSVSLSRFQTGPANQRQILTGGDPRRLSSSGRRFTHKRTLK